MICEYHSLAKKMSLFLKSQITKINFLSILIALFPISFIAGNMIIN